MPWIEGSSWTDLQTTNGSYTLPATEMVNSLGHMLDDFATLAVGVHEKLGPAIEDIRTVFDDAVAAYVATYACELVASPYVESTAPSTPSGALLSDQAYTDAFALARDAALQEKERLLWEAGTGSAAGGVGLPYAFKQAAIKQINQAYAQTINQAALTQSATKAKDQREDLRWYYGQKLEEFKAQLAERDEAYKFWDSDNKFLLEKADKMAADARAIQALLVAALEKTVYAYAGALDGHLKALLSAVNYSMSASAAPIPSVFDDTP
jgi:hypothetical protein